MFEQIIAEAVKEGLWALLFVCLLMYVIRSAKEQQERQEQREDHYQTLIESMLESLSAVESIRATVKELYKEFRDYCEKKTNSGKKRKTTGGTSSAVEKGETKKD